MLDSYGAMDLAEMLGLVEPALVPQEVSGPIAITCPLCHASPGNRCISLTTAADIGHTHVARERAVAQMRRGLA